MAAGGAATLSIHRSARTSAGLSCLIGRRRARAAVPVIEYHPAVKDHGRLGWSSESSDGACDTSRLRCFWSNHALPFGVEVGHGG